MNRSRSSVSAAYTLLVTLIIGMMSVFCLAPVHAVSPFIPAVQLVAEPVSETSDATPPSDGSSDAPTESDGNSSESVVVENESESASPASDASQTPTEPSESPAPADEGSGEISDPAAPPSEPALPAPPPVLPTEDAGPDTPESDNGGEGTGDTTDEGAGGTDEGAAPGGGEDDLAGNEDDDDLAGADEDPVPNGGLTLFPAPGTLPQAKVGESYSAHLTADGGAGAYTYEVVGAELLPLPAGLTLDRSSGVLSGVPSAVGKYSFTVEVSGAGDAAPVRHAYSIDVRGEVLGITVPGSSGAVLHAAQVGEPLVVRFGTAGGAGPYRYTIGGAKLADPGTLSRPEQLAVRPSVEHSPSALAGVERSVPVSVRRVEGAAAGGAAVGNLPAPLKLDSSGTLQGIPQSPGTYQFTVVSTDRYGSSTSKDFTLTVQSAGKQSAPVPAQGAEPGHSPSPSDPLPTSSPAVPGPEAPGAAASGGEGPGLEAPGAEAPGSGAPVPGVPGAGAAGPDRAPVPTEAQLAEGLESEVASVPLADTGVSLSLLFAGLATVGVGTALVLWQSAKRRQAGLH